MRRKSNQRNRPLFWIAAVALVVMAVGIWQQHTPRFSPATALVQGQAIAFSLDTSDDSLAAAERLLTIAASDEHLKDWALIARGEVRRRLRQFEEARSDFEQINEHSAAYIDAQTALLELTPEKATIEELNDLLLSCDRLKRTDLKPRLVRMRLPLVNDGERVSALLELPIENASQQKQVDPTLVELEKQLAQIATSSASTMPDNLWGKVVSRFNRSGRAELALELIQTRLAALDRTSPEYFRTLIGQELTLRALKRHEEADHVLSLVSADAPADIADRAILKIARNAWNTDDYDAASGFIDSLIQRFPNSSVVPEARYIQGRIFEELQQLPEARETYGTILSTQASLAMKLRAQHRVAWILLRGGDPIHAVGAFQNLQTLAESAVRANTADPDLPLGDALDEYFHATYWMQYAESDSAKAKPQSALLEETQPYGYYGLLTRFQQGEKTAPRLVGDPLNCETLSSPPLLEKLTALRDASLSELVRHEVDFSLQSAAENDLRELSRAALYADFGERYRSVGVADALLRNITVQQLRARFEHSPALQTEALSQDCQSQAIRLAYPFAYQDLVIRAAKKARVAPELLFALARTESHFRPNAVSRSGAMGLVQLMPATATMEGMRATDDLFSPQTNLELAALHVRRLLNQFGNNEIMAIAAYNSGSSAVNRWQTRYPETEPTVWIEMIGYPETKDYVKKVLIAKSIYGTLLESRHNSRQPG